MYACPQMYKHPLLGSCFVILLSIQGDTCRFANTCDPLMALHYVASLAHILLSLLFHSCSPRTSKQGFVCAQHAHVTLSPPPVSSPSTVPTSLSFPTPPSISLLPSCSSLSHYPSPPLPILRCPLYTPKCWTSCLPSRPPVGSWCDDAHDTC